MNWKEHLVCWRMLHAEKHRDLVFQFMIHGEMILQAPSQHCFLRNVYAPRLLHVFSLISSPHV